MRRYETDDKNNITIQYPDAVGFAFLPCIIKASGSNLSWIEVIIRHINIERSYNVETFNGSCITDFKTYVQALLTDISMQPTIGR